MSFSTPRILPEHLHNFVESNRSTPNTIRVLGTVASLRGDYATITCGNHGDISVILNRDTHIQVGRMVDIVGKVVDVEGVSYTSIRSILAWPRGKSSDDLSIAC